MMIQHLAVEFTTWNVEFASRTAELDIDLTKFYIISDMSASNNCASSYLECEKGVNRHHLDYYKFLKPLGEAIRKFGSIKKLHLVIDGWMQTPH